MSAYAHQMEREFSAQSLSSRGDSDAGNRFVEESGFYMTSFAAAIFVGSLVTVGVLFIALVITLSVMLQSCQRTSKGIIETQKSSDNHSYCKILYLHAELNSLEANKLPPVCWSLAIQYIREGEYARDLNCTMWMIDNYLHSLAKTERDVVLMDIDDIFAPDLLYTNPLTHRHDHYGCNSCIDDAKQLKRVFTLQLYSRIKSKGWQLILLSRKHERLGNSTSEHLISAGYGGWLSLIMRLDEEMRMDTREYLSSRRASMQKEGLNIICTISDQMDALTGLYTGNRIFKLPRPIFLNFRNQFEALRLSST